MESMKKQRSLQEHLVELLKGGQAHVDFESAAKNWPANLQGKKPEGAAHSPWELLEHMRIAQWDILEFSRDPKHVSPDWPGGYWPETPESPKAKDWDHSLKAFASDLAAMHKLVACPQTDLFARIPHGTGQTILRE